MSNEKKLYTKRMVNSISEIASFIDKFIDTTDTDKENKLLARIIENIDDCALNTNERIIE